MSAPALACPTGLTHVDATLGSHYFQGGCLACCRDCPAVPAGVVTVLTVGPVRVMLCTEHHNLLVGKLEKLGLRREF